MVERIRQILAMRGLSSTQFADTIGIGRPVVSHILSGRNKPSLEVMQKIMDAFPELALPWLLKGEGPMQASAPVQLNTVDTAEVINTPLASPVKKRQRVPTPAPPESVREAVKPPKESIHFPSEQAQPNTTEEQESVQSVPPVASKPSAASPAPVVSAPPTASALPAVLAATPTDKAIRRIIIFYQDGTFTDYQPEK